MRSTHFFAYDDRSPQEQQSSLVAGDVDGGAPNQSSPESLETRGDRDEPLKRVALNEPCSY
jgi:hypothetical protein